ncbi:hypothetical protein RND71_008425 [Anisodus tanguticus]|uniref:J domain-containing protein n=1 Tax=Anisodus tanguticus TaxID=243964 RepID=A0AAE1SQV1_9SOLA|nr:hypothetical protein RND71_008425 [Anisodus tanguticus]
MNRATKAAFQANPFQLRASLFHSSPILERRRRTHWDSVSLCKYYIDCQLLLQKSNFYSRRYRKLNSRQALFESVNGFAEQFFQSGRWNFLYGKIDSCMHFVVSDGCKMEGKKESPCQFNVFCMCTLYLSDEYTTGITKEVLDDLDNLIVLAAIRILTGRSRNHTREGDLVNVQFHDIEACLLVGKDCHAAPWVMGKSLMNKAEGGHHDCDEYDPSSSRDSSWFRRDFRASGNKGGRSRNKEQHQQRGFQFFEDEDMEIETFFRSAFGGNRYYYWSFINEELQWRNSSNYSNSHRWNWRHQYSDYDESTDSENSESDLSSERLTLGLNTSGPLNLEDVKNAYRVCALKWHPDRHQGSSKHFEGLAWKNLSCVSSSVIKLVLSGFIRLLQKRSSRPAVQRINVWLINWDSVSNRADSDTFSRLLDDDQ